MRGVRFLSLVLVLFTSACVVARGELPSPPTENDLRNDGSAAQKQALIKRYGVSAVPPGPLAALVVGDAVRPRNRFNLAAAALHPDIRSYISADPAAAAALPSTWWNWTLLGLTGTSLVVLSLMVAAEIVASAVMFRNGDIAPGQLAKPGRADFVATAYLFLGTPAMLVGMIVTQVALFVMSAWQSQAEDKALNTFNFNLARRVDAASSSGN